MGKKRNKQVSGVLVVRQDPSDPDLYRDHWGKEYTEVELNELKGLTIFRIVNKVPQVKKDIQRVKGHKTA